MGYACPVCDVPQQDGEHLANHMAFTAMTYGDDHESWLDEHVPEWSSSGPAELAPEVAELAEEAPYDTVFEDTVHDHAGHAHDGDSLFEEGSAGAGATDRVDAADARERGAGALDAEAQAVLDEAREMTREMLGEGDDDDDDGESADDGSSDDAGS
ncbi:DUF5810 domain-containing protein [Halogeometricum luteum]|uniref:DUF5810 domain-containing protein n=1 Tax=Halogeometricum luteum TaxID=2950537 RepID=A0ABU2FZR6_9EURY|nr:DUF5810 domain-containing protein [Halogeometricum sp. S3BR5-2]MDS0294032.1 DUF5810 domain-containing protein [Halogeometricum sp. S3BR5-2]